MGNYYRRQFEESSTDRAIPMNVTGQGFEIYRRRDQAGYVMEIKNNDATAIRVLDDDPGMTRITKEEYDQAIASPDYVRADEFTPPPQA